ncbi:MAG: DUF308 domain-containing protein [Pseudomonadota bacterium]|nr:DUF308 domain-containing protein [Pseudomonadota bacterium]
MPEKPKVRGWMLATGLFLVTVGLCFLLVPLLATFAAGLAAGGLLLVAGIAQLFDAVSDRAQGWGWSLAMGLVAAIAGVLLLVDPVGAMVGVTLLLASFLLVSGAMKIALSVVWNPVPGWGWMLFNGLITMFLGVLLIAGWPTTGLWTVGVFLGVDALLAGFSRIVRAVSLPELTGRDDTMMPTPRT